MVNSDTFCFVRVFYEKDQRVDEVVSGIPRKADRYLIDPNFGYSRIIPREGRLYTFADEFKRFGVGVRPAEEDLNAGIARVAQFLHAGKIRIFRECKNLIWEIERYHWARERETVRGISEPRPYKKDDHLCDCLRYIIMSRASTEVKKTEQEPSPKSLIAYKSRKKERERNKFE